MDICVEIFKGKTADLEQLTAKGNSFTEQAIYFIHLLDWVSFYLAERNGVDPFPVDVITYLKNELAKY
jgi:glucose/mannose-6-phosphate isomerase